MKRVIPKQIDIEVTSKCNLECRYCPAVTNPNATGHMDYGLFESIIERVDFPTTIVPWLNGEPMLHPRYNEMIQLIVKKDLPAYITTNGHFWRQDIFDLITEKNSIYQIIFSLDGLHHEGFNSIELARPGTDRRLVVSNIVRFMELADMKGRNIDIAVKICERGQDYEEIENFIHEWLLNGVDYVCVGRTLELSAIRGMRHYPCQYSDNNFMVVKWDGRLVACAYNDQVTNESALYFGQMDKTTPLLDIYNNEAYSKFRRDQRKGLFPEPCQTCGFAYTGTGMKGILRFRNPALNIGDIYYHNDYYNKMFSLKRSWKDDEYYGYHKE